MDLKDYIRDIKDFPKPGIVFKDICPLLADPDALRYSAEQLSKGWEGVTKVVGIESRGFMFGILVAQNLGLPFIPARKPGKLPAETVSQSYSLEYGEDTLEIHKDALNADDNVLIVDDLLATGGTLRASCDLVEKCGAKLAGCALVIELSFLEARAKFADTKVLSLLTY
ncbi:MAG: adenine phosphoribosyltransferase [Planctomycetota bacterium]|nr:adenine phosphoribosyltransferase [Planctomycetota bacterium]